MKEYKSAYFAGGCFWCITPAFKEIGAIDVICGYSGGDEDSPDYYSVKNQLTTHRETIRVIYDSSILSYSQLVDVFIKNVDPYNFEGQFIDRGYSYTLAIYYQNEFEKECAASVIHQLESNGVKTAISVEPFKFFCDAEEYHQNYYLKHPEEFKKEMEISGRNDYFRKK